MQQLAVDQWLSRDAVLELSMAQEQKSWLCHLDSMTRMIKQHAKRNFDLVVLSESLSQTTQAEQQFLGLSDSNAYIREIIMKADNTDWLFARSVFPAEIISDTDQSLRQLGNTPLGSLFFKDSKDRSAEDNPRQRMDAGLLSTTHELRRVAAFPMHIEQPLFARRSLFNYLGLPALVQEVFLPDHPIYHAGDVGLD